MAFGELLTLLVGASAAVGVVLYAASRGWLRSAKTSVSSAPVSSVSSSDEFAPVPVEQPSATTPDIATFENPIVNIAPEPIPQTPVETYTSPPIAEVVPEIAPKVGVRAHRTYKRRTTSKSGYRSSHKDRHP